MKALFKPKYKVVAEDQTLSSLTFGTITTLHYDDFVFPHWHLNQPLHIGDLVVCNLHYYTIVGTKKKILRLRQVVRLYNKWTILDDKVRTAYVNNVVLYKRCPQLYNWEEYQIFVNSSLPNTDKIITGQDELFMLLRKLKSKNTELAAKALKERVNRYLNINNGYESAEEEYDNIVDRILVLIRQ